MSIARFPTKGYDSGWLSPSYVNSWVNYGGWQLGGYRKIGNVVYLRGLVRNGTVGSTIFILPVGFRPTVSLLFPTVTGEPATLGRIDIQGSGEVTHATGLNQYVTLSGISFTVD